MNFLGNLKLGQRLTLGFAALILLSLIAAGMGIERIRAVNTIADKLGADDAEMLVLTQRWTRSIESNTARTWVVFFATEPTVVARVKEEMQAVVTANTDRIKRMGELATSPEQKQLIKDIAEQRTAFQALRNALLKRKEAGEDVGAEVLAQVFPAAQSYLVSVEKLADYQAKYMQTTRNMADQAASEGITALIIGTALAVIAGACLAWVLTRSIVVPLRRAQVAAEAIANGDLSTDIQVDSRDEIGQLTQSMQRMVLSLRGIVQAVRASSDSIATGSSQIAMGNADLSQRTEEQASNLQQTAASMEQLTSTIKQNADTARQASQLASSASAVAVDGGTVVGQVVATMEDITASSRKVADIIGVIDGIAFQTNILALNAAVEAARAGEQGRGFAVVASEVRSLAQRSAQAAKEIKSLIGESVEKVENGTRLVGTAGSTMQDVVQQVKRVTDLIGEITSASIEQSTGIGQIGDAVHQLDQVTQQNAALVEESAAASESLKHQAASLAQTVSVFKLA
ncbi:MAG: HAMP domain-containing protein [Rubrivivax sp.]|nr:MAG: HAMP domain-containing protein [Rubrivivax sp.]